MKRVTLYMLSAALLFTLVYYVRTLTNGPTVTLIFGEIMTGECAPRGFDNDFVCSESHELWCRKYGSTVMIKNDSSLYQ